MTSNATGLSWIVLAPVAIVTDIAAIGFVCHYKPFYHGSDVMVVSLLVAMTMNALLVVPIPAFTVLEYFQWNSMLCKFYVWAFVTFRIAQMLTLSAVCLHWSAIFKASSNNQNKGLTYKIKIISVIIWILAIIVGLVPVIGAVPDEFFDKGSCMFLTSDMGTGYTIFIFIFVVTCMFTAIISICDTTCLTKCMKKTAHVKYGAGRFYLPKKRSDIPGTGSYSAEERFHQLNFTWDLCRFFCIVISFCFIGNHLPFAILEFIQSTTEFNRDLVEEIIVWLILMEALIFPHLLWSCSKRYRHALVYSVSVYILRRPREDEEDPMSCTLKSYSRKVRDVSGCRNNLSDIPDVTRTVSTIEPETNNIDHATGKISSKNPEIVLQSMYNGRIQYCRTDSMSPKRQEAVPDKTSTETSFTTFHTVQTHTHKRNGSGGLNIKMGSVDLQRSSSGGSRQEWKEQMRKKHLPPIFTNDSFTADSGSTLNIPQENVLRSEGASGSVHSLYYLSGDYHPDYLNTDSLPRHRFEDHVDDNESEGSNDVYEERDINSVLCDVTLPESYDSENKPSHARQATRMHDLHTSEQNISHKKINDKAHSSQNHDSKSKHINNAGPISADEIDIYIYQMTDENKKHNLQTENKTLSNNVSIQRKNNTDTQCELPISTVVREPAEGYNEYDNQHESAVYHDSPQHKFSHDSWNNMVEPILKKNETDDLDVSLTSCDPTWRNLRNERLQNDRPLSHSPFDIDTDKGFEEALSVEYESVRSMSSLTSDSFGDSINVSNPFDFADDFRNESFKTQAIVSKSRPTSCSTVDGDNPFDYVPIETRRDVIKRTSYLENVDEQRPSFSTFKTSNFNTNNPKEDFGESFFGSDLRNGNTSTPNTNSPWPTTADKSNDGDCVFESDFNVNKLQHTKSHKQQTTTDKYFQNAQKSYSASSGDRKSDYSGGITMDVEPVFL